MYVIEYEYPGTANGQPVGTVYALDIGYLSPGSWSYSKDPNEATWFSTQDEAEAEASKHRWPAWRVIHLGRVESP